MVNQTLAQILASREDISEYLFHFTKGKNAFETLISILNDGKLKDVNRRGYLCFTEAPLTTLYNMFQIFERYDNPMYAPYGIGIKKNLLFNEGCRPVIYGTKEDFCTFPKHLYWRCEEYKPGIKDYSWLREWRIKSASYNLPEDSIIITKTDYEQILLMKDTGDDFDFDGDIEDGEYHGYVTGGFQRMYKGVSMEDIRNVCTLSKVELEKILSTQKPGDIENRVLGWF